MKRLLPRMGFLALGLAMLLCAVSAFGQEGDLVPSANNSDKKIPIGDTWVEYANQTLLFRTSVPLLAHFEATSQSSFTFKVRLRTGYPMPSAPAGSPQNTVRIYWVDGDSQVLFYDGGAPSEWITGTVNTEGGFVDR